MEMADPKAMLDRAVDAWKAADVDAWLALFVPDARFFVPGATSVSGDHLADAVRGVLPRLMRANGNESGFGLIDSYLGPNGAVALADQTVLRDGVTHHYHQLQLYEIGPGDADRFAFWWLMVHEYDAFDAAWRSPAARS
jgi:hypothetical protein